MPKNTHASRYGIMMVSRFWIEASCGKWKSRGTTTVR